MTGSAQHSSLEAAPSQLQYLQELGITDMQEAPVDHIVKVIEESLGERKFIEQARWFVLSVIADCTGERSQDSATGKFRSTLNYQDQLRLAQQLLEDSGARNSLASILRNRRARYKILPFAPQAQTAAQVLSNQSKAYSFVVRLLSTDLSATESITPERPEPETINHRRARRRQAIVVRIDSSRIDSTPEALRSSLSTTELEQFEKVLSKPVDEILRRKTTVRIAEDRLSLAAGFVTGIVVFVLAWLLLLQ
ncbi:MAG: hypothetical protein WD772_00590 [Pseudohongiellaceae bacterium]